jgi:hypothetical protein
MKVPSRPLAKRVAAATLAFHSPIIVSFRRLSREAMGSAALMIVDVLAVEENAGLALRPSHAAPHHHHLRVKANWTMAG